MDPKKYNEHVDEEIQSKYAFFVFLFSQKITFGPMWGSAPKKGSQLDPVVREGPPLGPKGPPWAQRAHLEAEGRLKGPLGPIGDPRCYPLWGAIGCDSP